MLHQACLNTGCWDTRVGLCFTRLELGTETPNRETWKRFLAARPATVRQLGKPQQPGNRGSPRPPDGPGVSPLPPPCQRLLSLPLSSWKRLPARRLPHRHLRLSQPPQGAPGVCHRECFVPSPGRQEGF